jgi:signal transduction histidine kinase
MPMEKELPERGAVLTSVGMSARDPAVSTILRVGRDAGLAATIEAAAGRIWPAVKIVESPSVEAAIAAPAGAAVLVLCDPAEAAIAAARAATDRAGGPRWGIAAVGAGDSVATVARALAAARVEEGLRRENARLRGDLATIGVRVAHDLRTPLGGVLTTAEMLREILQEDAPNDVAHVQPLIDSAESLVKLIQRVSFFANANAVRGPLQRVDMGGAFWNAFQHLESRIARAGAVLVQPKEWPEVCGHARWLEVVWRNLLVNALQHASPGVRVTAEWTRAGGELIFRLRDSGEVAPEKRALLWFPFERLHEPGAPRGLGLPMARRLVELQGGRCGYEPVEGGGSVFWFALRAPAA